MIYKDESKITSPSLKSGIYTLVPNMIYSDSIVWELFNPDNNYDNSLTYTDDLIYVSFSCNYEGKQINTNIHFYRHEYCTARNDKAAVALPSATAACFF